tara:strand:- start:1529 stop:2017 length:489 start_codon:yes stop_codon:yes gene_type:complete
MIIGAVIAAPIAAVMTFFGKVLWYGLSGIVMSLFSDLPNIAGAWIAEFTEPVSSGSDHDSKEIINIKQFGRYIWGKGTGIDSMQRTFSYKAYLKRNVLIGTYKRIGSKRPSGSGAFQLISHGNDEVMNGKCFGMIMILTKSRVQIIFGVEIMDSSYKSNQPS